MIGRRLVSTFVIAVSIATFGTTAASAAAPANDDFGSAIALSGTVDTSSTAFLTYATAEPGEPDHGLGTGAAHSIWYTLEPAASGPVIFDSCSSDPDHSVGTVNAAYTGSAVNALTPVTEVATPQCPPSGGTNGQAIRFNAVGGTVYHVAIDGPQFTEVDLRVQLLNAPPDTTPPQTTITAGPDEGATITDTTPSFEFASNEAGSTFQCKLDSQAFAACASPIALGPLGSGQHAFSVRAIDSALNVDATPATRSFSVTQAGPLQACTKAKAKLKKAKAKAKKAKKRLAKAKAKLKQAKKSGSAAQTRRARKHEKTAGKQAKSAKKKVRKAKRAVKKACR